MSDENWTLNYFNYFTEIEEHFQRARGTGLFLLSPLDWALIESWKNAGVPLEAVLRGIDAAFEKWRSRKSKTQKSQFAGLLRAGGADGSAADGGLGAGRVRSRPALTRLRSCARTSAATPTRCARQPVRLMPRSRRRSIVCPRRSKQHCATSSVWSSG